MSWRHSISFAIKDQAGGRTIWRGTDAPKQESKTPPQGAVMIALIKLDAAKTCLHRMDSDSGLYVCRAPAEHSGPHVYLPIDMVIITGTDDSLEDADPPTTLALTDPPLVS
jgi:hypothetical protein